MKTRLVLVAAMLSAMAGMVGAEPPWPWPDANAVARQLSSPDPKLVAQGMATADAETHHDVGRAVNDIRSRYLAALMDGRHYAEADRLALRGIVCVPQDLGSVEFFLNARIEAMLAAGQPDQALADAKSLYNVASMNDMPQAMLTVARCLNADHPKDLSWAERFRREQVAGAAFDGQIVVQADNDPNRPPILQPAPPITPAPTTRPTTQPDIGAGTVLASIRITDPAYTDAIEHSFGEDYASLCGRGNLLLLAGRTAEAKILFDRAYALGAPQNLADASENIARCMKAQDGAVGRANAWILSIRPEHHHHTR